MKLTVIILLLCSTNSLAIQSCAPEFHNFNFRSGKENNRVFLLWFPIQSGSQYTTSVCSSETGLPVQRYCFYNRTSAYGTWNEILSNNNAYLVDCSDISTTCEREEFKHDYILENDKIATIYNHWTPAQITQIADLEESCLDERGLPLTRLCLYNTTSYQTQWEAIHEQLKNVTCRRELQQQHVTHDLRALYYQVQIDELENIFNPKMVMDEMIQILSTPQTVLLPADIKITSDILKIVTTENLNIISEVINITNVLMNTDSNTIQTSEEVKAASTFLKTIDKYFNNMGKFVVETTNCGNTEDGVSFIQSKGLTLIYINPLCSNVSGFGLYDIGQSTMEDKYMYDANTGYHYRLLYLNQTLDELLTERQLLLATYFPLSLWEKLNSTTPADENDTVLKFIIFGNAKLFPNQTVMQHHPFKKVLEITIPDYFGDLPEDLPFILSYELNELKSKEKPVCGYWNDGTWLTTNVSTLYKNIINRNFLLCQSTHLSHFAALIGVNSRTSPSFNTILEYASIAGSALSLCCLICIWLTAIFFENWRSRGPNKVLLNMCFGLTLIMVLFLLLNLPVIKDFMYDKENSVYCQIMGGFLQYNILVLFIWMLIIAVMQYQRYVHVHNVEKPLNSIMIYRFIAWGIPLIPTCLVAYLDPETYSPSEAAKLHNIALCYPSKRSLTYGILLPVFLIIIANLSLCTYLLWSVRRLSNVFNHEIDRKNIIRQIRLSLLLFFLLGITWIFGMLDKLISSPILALLFAITSPLQGFVLFVYYIVIDKSTRNHWKELCCCKQRHTHLYKSFRLKETTGL